MPGDYFGIGWHGRSANRSFIPLVGPQHARENGDNAFFITTAEETTVVGLSTWLLGKEGKPGVFDGFSLDGFLYNDNNNDAPLGCGSVRKRVGNERRNEATTETEMDGGSSFSQKKKRYRKERWRLEPLQYWWF